MTRLAASIVGIVVASIFVAGCASTGRTLPTAPSVTVYCHQGSLTRTDLGTSGPSPADLITWWADVHDVLPESRDPQDSPVVGIASGFNVTTSPKHKMADGDKHEYRVSTFHLEWFDTVDEICWSGLHDYVHDGGQMINTARRPITGGMGRFLGRDGVADVTPLGDDWFRVDLYLTD